MQPAGLLVHADAYRSSLARANKPSLNVLCGLLLRGAHACVNVKGE